jgi:cobaltochelatase CobN
MRIFCVSTPSGRDIAEAAAKLKNEGIEINLKIVYPNQIDEERIPEDELRGELDRADVVLIDVRGDGRTSELLYNLLVNMNKTIINLVGSSAKLSSLTRLGSFSMKRFIHAREMLKVTEDFREIWKKIERIQRVIELAGKFLPVKGLKDARAYVQILKYWNWGGRENYYNMFLLLRRYFGFKAPKPKPPIERGETGIYHPDFGYFDNLKTYMQTSSYKTSRSTIGVLFFGGMHFEQGIPVIKALIKSLPEYNFIPVYSGALSTLQSIQEYFFLEGEPIVDCVVSLRWFRLNGGPLGGDPEETQKLLRRLKVPVFMPAPMLMREVKKWQESEIGLSPIEIITAVIWPELDGCVEPIPSCGLADVEVSGIECKEVEVIEDRIDRVSSRIENWIRLKKKRNDQKRIAVIIYGYPPGEANIGSAAYLDTFKSVERLLMALKGEGYKVDLPEKPLREMLEEYHIVNSGKWLGSEETFNKCFSLDIETYGKLFNKLPGEARKEVVETWGQMPGEVMTSNHKVIIPGLELGNIFLGLQPSRPPLNHEDVVKASHDKTKPPHHQYVAFYRWLEEIWQADCVIHVGTHGLAEFMKGKEVGLSRGCFPDILIGNLPHLYIYHVLNTSEAIIAKRRLYGTLISYNSPPYTTSDLYEDYLGLEELIHEYNEARTIDPARADRIKPKIHQKAKELNFQDKDIDSIQDKLYEMKRSIIPKGLHILGEEYSQEALAGFMILFLRYDRTETKSLNRILAESKGMNYNEMLRDKGKRVFLDEIENDAQVVVSHCLDKGIDYAVELVGLCGSYKKELQDTLNFGLEVIKDYGDNRDELSSLLNGLNFEFIEPSSGGDAIRSPEVLPTGRNLYQFDPLKVPTQTAYEQGVEIAENTLKLYLGKNSRYPESVGIVLWGFETTKTQGETIGQILHYLGVKIIRKPGGWHYELVPVPIRELGRPRIDVLLNICGFFREMFPNVMQLLDRAINLVGSLDESIEGNFVKKHSQKNYEELKDEIEAEKMDENTALRIANARIFGPTSSEYGTRLLPLVEDSVWEREEELAEVHIQSMNHLHAENIHALKADRIYRKNLSYVDLVSQVRDSNDYEITDLDHYYEFFGGLAKSVRTIKGKNPEMLISDTTKEIPKTESVGDAITHGVRTRLLNPKWADGMLKHDFHGAQKIADRVEYLIGLAATTGGVEDWIWGDVARRYILNPEMRRRLTLNNKWAAAQIVERLLEAKKRGYWDTTPDETKKLEEAYLEIEGWIEERMERE